MKEENKQILSYKQINEIFLIRLKQMKEENFTKPFFKNYHTPQNINGRYYKGSNATLLSLICENRNYQTGIFLTHKQIQDEGIIINKGEKSCYLIGEANMYRNKSDRNNTISYTDYMNLNDEEKKGYDKIICKRYYPVFNIEQTNFPVLHQENWEIMCEKYSIEKNRGENYIHPALHSIINNQKWICPIELSCEKEPGYSWNHDKIITPPMSTYQDVRNYYEDVLLYMSQSTGHPQRLHREFNQLGDERYIKDYLISSLTSVMIGSQLDMSIRPQKGFQSYIDIWINEIENNPSYASDILKSSAQSQFIINKYISEEINSLNNASPSINDKSTSQIIKIPEFEYPDLQELKKEQDYVYAIGKRQDGSNFKSLIYRRGTEFCYMLGSIIDGDLSTHFLDEPQKDIYKHLRECKTDSSVFLSNPERIVSESEINPLTELSINTPRRTLEIKDNQATILYHGLRYDATPILETFRKHDININSITSEEWKKLLLGQGLQLGKTRKAIFSIKKTPSGYGLKEMNEIIKHNTVELVKQ